VVGWYVESSDDDFRCIIDSRGAVGRAIDGGLEVGGENCDNGEDEDVDENKDEDVGEDEEETGLSYEKRWFSLLSIFQLFKLWIFGKLWLFGCNIGFEVLISCCEREWIGS